MGRLKKTQIRNLATGVKLAAELKPSHPDLRCFISVFAYQYNEQGEYIEMTKFLNRASETKMLFVMRKYEIANEFIENGWYASDDDLVNSIYLEDIKGIEELEKELLKYMIDLNTLEPEWKCEIPV